MNKLLYLAGALAGLLSAPAWASFDSDGCDFWLPDCSTLEAYPFLAADNDTRANLMMLTADLHHLTPPFSSVTAQEERHQPFVIERLALPDGPDERGRVLVTYDPALLQRQAAQLGVELSGVDLSNNKAELEGGRMVSNNPATLSQFFQALLDDDTLNAPQRAFLAQERLRLLLGEESAALPITQHDERFPTGSHAAAFLDYLHSARLFYQGDEIDASLIALSDSGQGWVKESTQYMLIRTAMNFSMANALDEYGMFDVNKSDKHAAAVARDRVIHYLFRYPNGRYADSAFGLYRRLYWIAGDRNAQAVASEQALARTADLPRLQLLINEVDAKLLSPVDYGYAAEGAFFATPDAPMLTLTQTLRRLRASYVARPHAKPVSEAEIDAYRPLFERADMLPAWRYLHSAWLFYQQKDYAGVEAAIAPPNEASLIDTVAFSQQVLRGVALQQQKKWRDAESHWRHLLKLKTRDAQQQFLQLMLANALVYQGEEARVFSADSPVKNLRFRSLILKNVADADLLRRQAATAPSATERTIALHTLLVRDLTHADYASYLQDKTLQKDLPPLLSAAADKNQDERKADFSDVDLAVFNWDGLGTEVGYYCPSLDHTAQDLVKNPADGHALNCIGEFFRLTRTQINSGPESGMQWMLSQAPTRFVGKAQSRLTRYQQIIADPHAEPEDVSYALYRAVMCYAPSGYNGCDDRQIAASVRKGWFQRLKSEFETSPWAQKLRYYW